MAKFGNWFVKITGWLLAVFAFKTKVYYEDKSVQSRRIRGKAIVMSNHFSIWDFASLLFVFWTRTLRCVVAELLYEKNIFFTTLLKALGCIKVDRNMHDFSFIDKCRRILDRGGVVEIYPEARVPGAGDVVPLEFKPSVVYLALESGAPIIPVYTDGRYFRRKRNYVMIGKPINVSELYDPSLTEKENISAITAILRGKVIELREKVEKEKTAG